jgi:teichuronic acid biosynthesis glycosyltransferase TuaG
VTIPQVSVIMPAYNAGTTIAESIQSVLNQTFRNWELIIVDDGSTDNTGGIVNNFINADTRLVLLSLGKNRGLANARNEGCKMARGDYIAFLDSDDLWHSEKLRLQLDFHLSNRGIEISHTDFHFFDVHGILKRPLKYLVNQDRHKVGKLYPRICYNNPVGILTVMATKTLLQEAGFFDTALWTMEDQDLWVRIAKMGKAFGYIPRVLAYYRLVPGSITSKTGKYKKAYKTFMSKVSSEGTLDGSRLLQYYYRYFGTIYFRDRKYRLAKLFFCKSIMVGRFGMIAITTALYFLYAVIMDITRKIEQNGRSPARGKRKSLFQNGKP